MSHVSFSASLRFGMLAVLHAWIGDWGLGIGDWGSPVPGDWGSPVPGDWGSGIGDPQSPRGESPMPNPPNPQSPIPSPQSPVRGVELLTRVDVSTPINAEP